MLFAAEESERTGTEALHREREIEQTGLVGEGFADQAERSNIERIALSAVWCGHDKPKQTRNTEFVNAFAGLIVTGLMGVGMYVICVAIEQRMTGWATRGSEGVTFGN